MPLFPAPPVCAEGDRQYFLSVRYGRIEDGATLRALLTGRLPGQALQADGDTGGDGGNGRP